MTPLAAKIFGATLEAGPEIEEDLETRKLAGFVTSRNGPGESGTWNHKGWPIDLVAQVDANWAHWRSITEAKAHGVSKIIQFVTAVRQTCRGSGVAGVKGGRGC